MERIRAFLSLEFIRNFLKLFSGTILAQGLSFLLAPLFSRLYQPEDFGLVALYLSILSVVSVISTGKYEQAIMLPRQDKTAVALFSLVQLITIVVSLLVFIPVLFFNSSVALLLRNPAIGSWLYWIPLSLLLHGLGQASIYYANRNKMFGEMAGGTVFQYSVLNATRLGAGWFKTPFNGLVASQIAGQLAAAIYMLGKIKSKLVNGLKELSWSEIKASARQYSGYPRYNLFLNLTNNLSGSLPIFLFTWGFSAQTAGLYAFGYTFVFRPLSMFSQSTMQVLSQKIIEDYHMGKWIFPSLKKLVLRFFMLGIIPFAIIALLGPWLFEIIFSDEYQMSGRILQILTPWLFLVFLTSPLSFIPELFFRQKKAMIIDMIYLVLRFFALATGIYFENVWLALGLFSTVSVIIVLYNLLWYLRLAYSQKNI